MNSKVVLAVLLLGIFIYQKRDAIDAYLNPPPPSEIDLHAMDFASRHTEPVVMYGTSWCGYCAKARALFEEQGVAYYEYDIEQSAVGEEQYNLLGGGGVPLMIVNNQVIQGFKKKRILKALN